AAVLVHAGVLLMKTWVVCAVVVVGAGVLLATQWEWDREPSSARRAGRETRAMPSGRESAPAGAEELSAVGLAEKGARPRGAPGKDERNLLRGRILLPDGVRGPVAVEVYALDVYGQIDGGSVTRIVAEQAPFSIPVAKLIADERTRELEVRVDHADCLPVRHRVKLTPSAKKVVPEVDIGLLPAAIVTGRVVDTADGAAAGANVAVFRADADGAPEEGPVDSARTDDKGRYRLRAGRTGPYLVTAEATGFLPAHGSVDLTVGHEVEAASLVLRRGLAITGRITINGRAPSAAVHGFALLRSGGRLLSWLLLGWKDGRLVRCTTTGRCDPNGDFRIAGLVPGSYEVSAKDLQGAHPDLGQAPGRPVREVEAPADGIHIDLPVSRLRILVLADGAPAIRSGVLVTGRSSMHLGTDAQGRVDLAVSPGASYEVQVWRAEFKPLKKRLEAPPAGRSREIILDLERERPLGTVLVRFEPGDGVDPDSLPAEAGFGFFKAESKAANPGQWRDPIAKNGVFRLQGLTPGRHRLVVRPGVTWHKGLSYWRPAETWVDIPDGDEVAVTIRIERGGLIRIVARAPDGAPVRGPCTVRDDRGRNVPVVFQSDGGTVQSSSWIDDGPTDVGPAFPPGTYTVELSPAGYRSATRHVRVEAGRTTDVALALVPR
ncbi:MAG: carboxypeptidase-like regulatory domain-containing protein, partial [Planctomycetota bacterium]